MEYKRLCIQIITQKYIFYIFSKENEVTVIRLKWHLKNLLIPMNFKKISQLIVIGINKKYRNEYRINFVVSFSSKLLSNTFRLKFLT